MRRKNEKKEVNSAYKSISDLDYIMGGSADEWEMIAEYNTKKYGLGHINVGVPRRFVNLIKFAKVPSDKQMKKAVEIRKLTYEEGFDFIE
jgi:hypothetical protein